LFLFPPCGVALVFAELLVAQVFEGLPFAPSLLEDFLLLVAQILPAQQFGFGILAQLAKGGLAAERETHFCGGGAGCQVPGFANMNLPDPFNDLIETMANFGNLLIRRAQAQFLLMFDALPKMKYRLEGKMKGHGSEFVFL
jgi:hypothetical protein